MVFCTKERISVSYMKSAMKKLGGGALLTVLLALTSFLMFSCTEKNAPSPEAQSTTQGRESTSPFHEPETDPAYDFPYPGKTEIKPDGIVDADADTLTTLVIRTAEDLIKIGNDPDYPLNGDYTLVADLDLSHIKDFTPIGGSFSECGIVSGNNVFSGTFDGRGHTLVGLNISISETDRIHVGLFGSVGSSNSSDPAVIKNLILKDVTVTGPALGSATYAALIGQANGNVIIDNIALLSGKVEIDNESGDILGIGSLIGQCRTRDTTGCTNAGIHVSNIYSNITIIGDNNGRSNYTSGLIGRIRGSSLGTLANIVQLGTVTHEKDLGHAIAAGDSLVIDRRNVYYLDGIGNDENSLGSATSKTALTSGRLVLDTAMWHSEKGIFPILKSAYESPLFSPLDYLTISFTANGAPNEVKSDFILPNTILGEPVKWMSHDEKVISIKGHNAYVTNSKIGKATVVLTAYTRDASRDFVVQVASSVEPELIRDFSTNTLYAKNYPTESEFTWIIDTMNKGVVVNTITETEGQLPLTDEMLNCRITLKVPGYEALTFYHSSIPTLVITSPLSYNSISSSSYAGGTMTICTTTEYPKTEYSDSIEIKLRGNSTAHQSKRPFRLRLDGQTNLFDMGKSKHWVLLANHFDRSNLRNKLSYDLGMSLGLAGCESTFVNVIFNGQYCGLYQLCEAIRIEEGRVDIYNWDDTADRIANIIAVAEGLDNSKRDILALGLKSDLSWVTEGVYKEYTISDYYDTSTLNITGGYLIENDDYYDERVKFTTTNNVKLQFHGPEKLSSNKEMFNYIKTYIQNMEDALYSPNRLSSEGLHYTDYMDIDSFLDFFMVNQVFKNVELFYKSCYMYKDVDGLLTFGPIWDMDWTAGNHVNLDRTSSRYDCWNHGQSQDREFWFRAVYNDPYFMVLLYERWAEIQSNLDQMMVQLDLLAESIAAEANLNFEYWNYYQNDVDWEVDSLRTWLINRRNWMNEQMKDPATLLSSLGYYIYSEKLFLSEPVVKEDCIEITVTIKGNTNFVAADLLINGKIISREDISDGSVIRIDKSLLRESGKMNSVEILGVRQDGKYSIIENRKGQKGSTMVDSACVFYMSE